MLRKVGDIRILALDSLPPTFEYLAGGLGSLPCTILDTAKVRAEICVIRQQTQKPENVTLFCHKPAALDLDRDAAWKRHLAAYYEELGLDASASAPAVNRAPFDEAMGEIVEDLKPEVVSFSI